MNLFNNDKQNSGNSNEKQQHQLLLPLLLLLVPLLFIVPLTDSLFGFFRLRSLNGGPDSSPLGRTHARHHGQPKEELPNRRQLFECAITHRLK